MLNHKVNGLLIAYLIYAIGCSCAGWSLSAIHCLDISGYFFFGLIASGFLVGFRRQLTARFRFSWQHVRAHIRRRISSLFSCLFIIVAALVFLSGVLHPQDFGDANSYHVPRVIYWLQSHTWQWIPTYDNRQNNRGCAFEWMTAPLLLLSHTDRLLFLVNWIPLLLFPGLIFQNLLLLRVSRLAAWHWMWLFPTAIGFVCQAGVASTDFLGGFFALAAINLALLSQKRPGHFLMGLSLAAFALATGTKPFILLLGLPFAFAFYPVLGRLLTLRPVYLTGVILVVFFTSYLPSAGLNFMAVRDWSGLVLEPWVLKPRTDSVLRFAVSGFSLILQNVIPLVVPHSGFFNQWITTLRSGPFGIFLSDHFEGGIFFIPTWMSTESAALGPIISLLLAGGVFLTWRHYFLGLRPSTGANYNFWLKLAPFLSLGVLLSVSTLSQMGRIAMPFYALLLAGLLSSPGQTSIVQSKWWRFFALLQMGVAIFGLLFAPVRPIFPIRACIDLAEKHAERNQFLDSWGEMYFLSASRVEGYVWLRSALPDEIRRLGLIRFWYQGESVLWKPVGQREVPTVASDETPLGLRLKGISEVAISKLGCFCYFNLSDDGWRQQFGGRSIGSNLIDGDRWQLVAIDSGPPTQWSPAETSLPLYEF